MGIELRTVAAEAFEDIYPLMLRFPSPKMTKADWRWLLFDYPWEHESSRGWALYADGKAVGFMGAVFSVRPLLGRMEKFCNPTSWIVLDEYRNASMLLLTPILALRDHTLVNLTPSDAGYQIFARLGFSPLESEQLVFPPLPDLGGRVGTGSYTLGREALQRELEGRDQAIHRDMSSSAVAHHALLRKGGRTCYVVATRTRKKRVPLAEIHYISDLEFFWENRLLAHRALIRSMGLPGLALTIDGRHCAGRPPSLAVRIQKRRLYRPSRADIVPGMIDGLYSELVGLRL